VLVRASSRPLAERYILRALVRAQQGFRPAHGGTQRLDALQSGMLQPLADRALGDAQGLGNLLLCPTLLGQFPGTEAAAFLPTSRRVAIGCAHSPGVQHIPAHDY
jgi:hypothetical protein